MENFNTLNATVSGGVVTLNWSPNTPGFPPLLAYSLQRKPFGRGDDAWATILNTVAPSLPLAVSLILGGSNSISSANSYSVLAATAITNTGASVLSGNLGMSPGSAVTGFPPGSILGSVQVGTSAATAAMASAQTAYTALANLPGATTISGDIGGQTLTPGVYKSASSIGVTGTLTLDAQGNPNATFVIIAGSTVTTAAGNSVINLVNGAQAANVYWIVGSSATLGTNTTFNGTIIAVTSITVTTGAQTNSRLIALNGAVTLDTNSVTVPVFSTAPVIQALLPPPQTDSPGVGDWAYRVVGQLVQGNSVPFSFTNLYSNQVNVSTEAATGEVTLTLVKSTPREQPSYTQVDLSWTIAGTAVDVRFYEVQRTTDGGAHWRSVHEDDEFEGTTFTELLPNNTGTYFWRVIAHMPSATPPYNADVLSTSNSVTVTI